MKLMIKNMVCPRCILVVKQILSGIGVEPKSVLLGEVELHESVDEKTLQLLNKSLLDVGFEILDDPDKQLVDAVKNAIIMKVQQGNIEPHFSLSYYLKSNTLKDYSTLTKVFSAVEGCTIEKFFILQKLEKVKELLLYRQMPVKLIANKLGYSSTQHLSMQFKKVHKLSPKEFVKLGAAGRQSIDNVHVNSLMYKISIKV